MPIALLIPLVIGIFLLRLGLPPPFSRDRGGYNPSSHERFRRYCS